MLMIYDQPFQQITHVLPNRHSVHSHSLYSAQNALRHTVHRNGIKNNGSIFECYLMTLRNVKIIQYSLRVRLQTKYEAMAE